MAFTLSGTASFFKRMASMVGRIACALVIAVLFLVVCRELLGLHSLSITNDSGEALTRVAVRVRSKQILNRSLALQERATTWFFLGIGEASYVVDVEYADGSTFRADVGYVDSLLPGRDTIRIRKGDLVYDDSFVSKGIAVQEEERRSYRMSHLADTRPVPVREIERNAALMQVGSKTVTGLAEAPTTLTGLTARGVLQRLSVDQTLGETTWTQTFWFVDGKPLYGEVIATTDDKPDIKEQYWFLRRGLSLWTHGDATSVDAASGAFAQKAKDLSNDIERYTRLMDEPTGAP